MVFARSAKSCSPRAGQWWQPKLYIHWPFTWQTLCTLMICRAKLYIHWASFNWHSRSTNYMHIDQLDLGATRQCWLRKLYAHRASVNRFWRSWSLAKPICMHIVQLCQQRGGQWWPRKLYIHWACSSKTLYTLAVRNENSIYIEPFLSHNDHVIGA